MKILIFGGGGRLGTEVNKVLGATHTVVAPSSKDCDITDLHTVETVVKDYSPDLIVHLAAIVGAKECESNRGDVWNVNVLGTVNIVRICNELNIRLLFTSSAAIFDGEQGNYTETDIPNPQYFYAVTKVAAEQAVSVLNNYAIVRLDFFPLEGFKYSNVFTDHYTSKIPLNEAADKVSRVAVSDYTGVINIGQERESLYEILKVYFPDIQPITISESALPDFPRDISLDLSRWKSHFENVN